VDLVAKENNRNSHPGHHMMGQGKEGTWRPFFFWTAVTLQNDMDL
jgi:hypothetical protein